MAANEEKAKTRAEFCTEAVHGKLLRSAQGTCTLNILSVTYELTAFC